MSSDLPLEMTRLKEDPHFDVMGATLQGGANIPGTENSGPGTCVLGDWSRLREAQGAEKQVVVEVPGESVRDWLSETVRRPRAPAGLLQSAGLRQEWEGQDT